jgi:repressor LexA
MRNLTLKQRDVLDFVIEHVADYGFSPTRIEIQRAFKYRNQNSVDVLLLSLEKKRFLKVIPKQHRGIQVLRNYQ